MHMLSSHNRSEFLATPHLIRFDYAHGRDGFEPTLLIKGSTVLLKYIVFGARMQLAFTMCDGRLLCALKVCDDGDSGGILWSVVERREELNGIRGLVVSPRRARRVSRRSVTVGETSVGSTCTTSSSGALSRSPNKGGSTATSACAGRRDLL